MAAARPCNHPTIGGHFLRIVDFPCSGLPYLGHPWSKILGSAMRVSDVSERSEDVISGTHAYPFHHRERRPEPVI